MNNQFLLNIKKAIDEFEKSKIMENIIPRDYLQIKEQFDQNQDLEGLTLSLSKPVYDLLDRGGKRIRPFLCMLIADLFNQNRNLVYPIAGCVEIIHNATLIIDDIEDASVVRRNQQCVHIKYGTDIAINAGSHAYFACLQYLLNKTDYSSKLKLKLQQICIKHMTQAHLGQGWDILWHNQIDRFPTKEQYLQMVGYKTGALLKMPVELCCALFEQDDKIAESLSKFAGILGMAFQIQDDILNLIGTQTYKNTKGYMGEDIHEGKFTLMVIHTLQQKYDNSNRLLEILKLKTNDQQIIDEAIKIMLQNGSIEFAQQFSQKLIQQALDEVESLQTDNEEVKQSLRQFATFLVARES